MESVLVPPAPFRFDKNSIDLASGTLNEAWKKWRNSYEIYVKACELDKKSVEAQLNILLHVIGEECREILNQGLEKYVSADGVLKKLDEYFEIKINVTVERHNFFTRNQKENETIEQYVFELRRLSQTCDFKNLKEDLIKDRLVCGVCNYTIRERLLREDELNLKKALEICRAAVASKNYSEKINIDKKQVNEINNKNQTEDEEVWVIDSRRPMPASSHQRSRGGQTRGRGGRGGDSSGGHWLAERALSGRRVIQRPVQSMQRSTFATKPCDRCGSMHAKYKCPAYGKKCMRCFKMNHFARRCGVGVFQVEEFNQDSETTE